MLGFQLDIESLLLEYVKKELSDFSSFKELWKKRRFSYIHEGCPEYLDEDEYTRCLFVLARRGLDDPNDAAFAAAPFSAQLASIYALYLLYETQHSETKVKIYVPIDVLARLVEVLKTAKQKGLPDPCAVLHAMWLKNSFLFGAVPPIPTDELPVNRAAGLRTEESIPLKVVSRYLEESIKTTPVGIPCAEIDAASQAYVQARRAYFAGCRRGVPSANRAEEEAKLFQPNVSVALREMVTHYQGNVLAKLFPEPENVAPASVRDAGDAGPSCSAEPAQLPRPARSEACNSEATEVTRGEVIEVDTVTSMPPFFIGGELLVEIWESGDAEDLALQ